MVFRNSSELIDKLRKMREIGFGSQGTAYYDPITKKVYKIFFYAYEEDFEEDKDTLYKESELLKFKDISNDTVIFPKESIIVKDEIVGYITPFVEGKNLDRIDPLKINYNSFLMASEVALRDIEKLSYDKVAMYDVIYNTMYKDGSLKIIDTDEFSYSSKSIEEINQDNMYFFNTGLILFLTYGLFEEFIQSNSKLSSLYSDKKDIITFLKVFRDILSKKVGKEIITLEDASSCLNKHKIKDKRNRFIRNY